MKTRPVLLFALLLPLIARAQLEVPERPVPNTDLPIVLDSSSPLDSLERQLLSADFDQRGALATAFDTAVLSVDERIAELRSQGLESNDEAEENLADAREAAAIAFRDLSLVTEETWKTGRHNGVMALRKVRGALEVLARTAAAPQS